MNLACRNVFMIGFTTCMWSVQSPADNNKLVLWRQPKLLSRPKNYSWRRMTGSISRCQYRGIQLITSFDWSSPVMWAEWLVTGGCSKWHCCIEPNDPWFFRPSDRQRRRCSAPCAAQPADRCFLRHSAAPVSCLLSGGWRRRWERRCTHLPSVRWRRCLVHCTNPSAVGCVSLTAVCTVVPQCVIDVRVGRCTCPRPDCADKAAARLFS